MIGSVIDVCAEYAVYILQIKEKNVRLFMSHAFLLHVDTDSSSYLMLNPEFHSCHLLLFLQKHLQMFRRCPCIMATYNLRARFYASVAASASAVSAASSVSSATSQ